MRGLVLNGKPLFCQLRKKIPDLLFFLVRKMQQNIIG